MRFIIDDRICRGMPVSVCRENKRLNGFVYKVISEGKRIIVYLPASKEFQEFNLRKNGVWAKLGEKTEEVKTTLSFPVLIRKDLLPAFGKIF